MSRRQTPFEIDVEALLERGRTIERLPDTIRARALARARAFASAPPVLSTESIKPRTGLAIRGFAAGLAVAALAAIAAAFSLRDPSTHRAEPLPAAPACTHACPTPAVIQPPAEDSSERTGAPELLGAPATAVAPPAAPAIQRPREGHSPEAVVTELDLLRHAHAAYVARDFPRALSLLAEQARRFPNGALAEEREALRVRSLAASGRAEEARRAAAAFAERFPRSVLVTQIQKFIPAD